MYQNKILRKTKKWKETWIIACTESFYRQKQSSRGVLLKNVFIEISQNSQENTCARDSSLIKLQVSAWTCKFCETFKNTFS